MRWAYLVSIHVGILASTCALGAGVPVICKITLTESAKFESTPLLAVDAHGEFALVAQRGIQNQGRLIPFNGVVPGSLTPNSGPLVVGAVSAAPDRPALVALGDADGNIEVSRTSGEPLYRIDPLNYAPIQTSFSSNGKWLLAVEPGLATLHPAEEGGLVRSMYAPGLSMAAFSPLTSQIGTVGADGRARAWWMGDLSSRGHRELHTNPLNDVGHPMTTLAFAPRHSLLATGDIHGGVRLFDPKTGQRMFHGQSTDSPITSVNFSLDGTRLLSTNEEGFGQIWNTGTGGSPIVIPAQKYGAISKGYLIRDGKYALTSHADGKVRIWELQAPAGGRRHAKIYYEYSGHNGPIVDLQMLPDSQFLTTGEDGKVMHGTIPPISPR